MLKSVGVDVLTKGGGGGDGDGCSGNGDGGGGLGGGGDGDGDSGLGGGGDSGGGEGESGGNEGGGGEGGGGEGSKGGSKGGGKGDGVTIWKALTSRVAPRTPKPVLSYEPAKKPSLKSPEVWMSTWSLVKLAIWLPRYTLHVCSVLASSYRPTATSNQSCVKKPPASACVGRRVTGA